MAKLIYSMMASLDGYVNDSQGKFDWGQGEDAEYLAHSADQAKRIGTEIYGRKMYETMVYWESHDPNGNGPDNHFAKAWQSTDKLVFSKSLTEPRSKRTRVLSRLDVPLLQQLKNTSDKDLSVSGPTLASALLAEGLVDEIGITYAPVVVGGGTPFFKSPPAGLSLKLVEHTAFKSGSLFLRYRVEPKNGAHR